MSPLTQMCRNNRTLEELAETLAWRIKVLEWTVARGKQDPRDYESVLANGYVAKPIDDFRRLAIEAAKDIDAKYTVRKRR